MRSITQNIVLDRLQRALVSRGVDMKRSAVLEVAAESFGFLDGNAFVAAMKEGRFDPPFAEVLGVVRHGDSQLTVLRDPVAASVYAIDTDALDDAVRGVRFGASPYGGLLRMPDETFGQGADESPAPGTDGRMEVVVGSSSSEVLSDGRVRQTVSFLPAGPDAKSSPLSTLVFVTDRDGNTVDEHVAEWSEFLSPDREIEVGHGPVSGVMANQMVRIDGRLHFAFVATMECESHEQGLDGLRRMQEYVDDRAEAIRRVGGWIRCVPCTADGAIRSVEMETFLPAILAQYVDDASDWREAVGILLGAKHQEVLATFGPQVWVDDDAHEVDPQGDTEFDVAFEVLLMGSARARDLRDYRDESDDLRMAAFAPDWIRNWNGPFYVTVEDEIGTYLDRKESKAPAPTATEGDVESGPADEAVAGAASTGAAAGMTKDDEVVYVVDVRTDVDHPEVRPWRHLLTADYININVDCDPVHDVDAFRMATIGGRLHFLFTTREDYDSHEDAVLAMKAFEEYVATKGETVRRVGGMMRCSDDFRYGCIEMEAFLPVELARDVDDLANWHEAVALLLGAESGVNDSVLADFSPRTRSGGDAPPQGETRFDVTAEILLMGSEKARAIRDGDGCCERLRTAALAPDWIRNWTGPFHVTVQDEIGRYLDERTYDGALPTDDEVLSENRCDECDQDIDYDTGVCTGCGQDHSNLDAHAVDVGILKTVLPEDADRLAGQTGIDDPV